MRADVERIDIGGVAVYLAERGGDTHVGLVLDVGVADEPLPVRGVTHLCERLLLTSLDPFDDLRRHATVGWQTTQFRAVGRPDEASRFLELVVARLRALPLERHERERALLRAETAHRPSTMAERLLRARFGATTFGRAGYPEYGLWQLDDDSTRDWAVTRCTARRAALWISGPAPHDVAARLALDLAPGLGTPPRSVQAVVDLPAHALAKVSGPNLSVVADRGVAIQAAIVLLRDHLDRALRHERGLATAIGATCDALDGCTLHAHVGADAAATHRAEATTALLDEVARFATDGPDAGSLERFRHLVLEARRAPSGRAAAAAVDHTLGRADPLDDELDAIEALDAPGVAAALTAALDRGLLVTGDGTGPHPGYRRTRRGTVGPAPDGTRHRAAGSDEAVVVGEHGVCFLSGPPPGTHWTVDVAGCAAVLAWDDGRRVVIGHDATHLDVAPWRFERGRELVDAIDTTMPAALRVAMGAGEGPPAPTAPGARRRRMWGALTLATTAGVAFALGSWLGSSGDGAPDERQRRSELADVGAARLAATTRAEQMIEDGDVAGGGSLRFTDARCDLPTALEVAVFLCRADGDDGAAHTLQAQQRGVGPVTVTFVV